MLKNEQCLLPSRGALTPPSIYFLHDYCREDIKKQPQASLTLIKLYTNRRSVDIVNNLQIVTLPDGTEELRLHTVWDMPINPKQVEIEQSGLQTTSIKLADNMYLVLPIELKPAAKLTHYFAHEEDLDKWLMSYVPSNQALPSERLTLNRIEKVIAHYGAFVDISDYEQAFISSLSLDKESHQHYGIVNRNLVQLKFDTFRMALSNHDLSPKEIKA
jgi:hypothetical protein